MLETYVASIPLRQTNIVRFFKMIKPLIEGTTFFCLNSQTTLKLEVHPQKLQFMTITDRRNNTASQLPLDQVE